LVVLDCCGVERGLEARWVAECLRTVREVFPKLRDESARVSEVVDIQDDFWNGFERVLDSVDDGLLKLYSDGQRTRF
jgi:hypothetical protein